MAITILNSKLSKTMVYITVWQQWTLWLLLYFNHINKYYNIASMLTLISTHKFTYRCGHMGSFLTLLIFTTNEVISHIWLNKCVVLHVNMLKHQRIFGFALILLHLISTLCNICGIARVKFDPAHWVKFSFCSKTMNFKSYLI